MLMRFRQEDCGNVLSIAKNCKSFISAREGRILTEDEHFRGGEPASEDEKCIAFFIASSVIDPMSAPSA
jgi:hypothetical protein